MSDRNVTPNTATSSRERLQEIRARFDLWKLESDAREEWDAIPRDARPAKSIERFLIDKCGCGHKWCGCADEWYPVFHHEGDGYDHALSDIAWLLEQVEELTRRVRMYEVVKS